MNHEHPCAGTVLTDRPGSLSPQEMDAPIGQFPAPSDIFDTAIAYGGHTPADIEGLAPNRIEPLSEREEELFNLVTAPDDGFWSESAHPPVTRQIILKLARWVRSITLFTITSNTESKVA